MGMNGSTNGIKPLKGNSSSRATVSFFLVTASSTYTKTK